MITTKHIGSNREFQHSLMQILQQAKDSIFLVDEGGHILQSNASMERWFQQHGIEHPHRLFSIFPTLSLLQWRRINRSLQDQQPQYLELPIRSQTQPEKGVMCSSWLVRLRDQGLICWMVNCPETSKSEQGIKENAEKAKVVGELMRLTYHTINQARDMICWTRENGSIFYSNVAFWETLGYTEQEMTEKNLYDFFPDYLHDEFLQGWYQLKSGEIPNGKNLTISHRDGSSIPVGNSSTFLQFEGAPCCVTLFRNLTEQKKMEEALYKALHRIKKLNRELTKNNTIRKEDIAITSHFGAIISEDPAFRQVLKNVEQVVPTNTTVLITGETGTGKELLVKSIDGHG